MKAARSGPRYDMLTWLRTSNTEGDWRVDDIVPGMTIANGEKTGTAVASRAGAARPAGAGQRQE